MHWTQMHWTQHQRHGSATHLRNTGNDPSAHPKAQAPQVPPLHVPHLWYFTLPSPLLAFPWMLRTHTTSRSGSSSRDKPQGGHRSKGRTSVPGHYSKQKASPAGLCSTRAAVNETIYCIPISVQPLDPRTASPIVLSALIKAGSSRHLRPVQLGQSGSSSEEGDREVSAAELCAEQGAFVTQETRSHSREENGNYFGALPSPPRALPTLTPGGINAGRLSACLHPCPCHRTLALTNSLTATPALWSRHVHQSRWSQGAVLLKTRQSTAVDEGLPQKNPYSHICSQQKDLYPPPQNSYSAPSPYPKLMCTPLLHVPPGS